MSDQPEEPRPAGPFEAAVHTITGWLGGTPSIGLALVAVALWALARPLFASHQDWIDALVLSLAVLSFLLMLFLQRSQNKDTLALQLKLNELIASQRGASNRLIDLENLSEAEAHQLHHHYQRMAKTTKNEDDRTAAHTIEESTRE